MNNKYYVGKNAQDFEKYDDVTISGIILKDNNASEFQVGDQNGYVLQIKCKYATQQMADELFGLLGGKVYRGYRATNANLDPLAELGDGITVNGLYSVLAYRRVNFGPEHMSEIAAPGNGDLNHEYQAQSYTEKGIEKSQEETKKEIEKSADEVREDAKDIAEEVVASQTQEDIFNKLTNGGVDQGIYLQKDDDGVTRVYINLEYLKSNVIDLNRLYISGDASGKAIGLMKGYGKTAGGDTTQGVVMYGNGADDGERANPPYIIVTNAGVRLQSTEENNFNVAGAVGEMVGTLSATQDITAGRNISATGSLYAGKKLAAQYTESTELMTFGHNEFRSWLSGRQAYVGERVEGYESRVRGATVYLEASTIYQTVEPKISSDERVKKDISPLTEDYVRALDEMIPVTFRYRYETDKSPLHIGYTTQNVQQAFDMANVGSENVAALGPYEDENGEERMSLAYGELIPLLHAKIKVLESELISVREEMEKWKSKTL